MPTMIPDLWPDDIDVNVLTPLAILRVQASLLAQRTNGLLEAEVATTTNDSSALIQHQLDLIAPALGGYRHRILTATHRHDRVYPVWVAAECFEPDPDYEPDENEDWSPEAESYQKFIELVGEVLRSREVKSLVQSLLARSNEQNNSPLDKIVDSH